MRISLSILGETKVMMALCEPREGQLGPDGIDGSLKAIGPERGDSGACVVSVADGDVTSYCCMCLRSGWRVMKLGESGLG